MTAQSSYLDFGSAKEGLERFAGVKLTNPGTRHTCHRPQGTKGRTVFRIYPYVTPEGVERPLRLEPEVYRGLAHQPNGVTCDNAFYPWMIAEDFVTMAGVNQSFTCFTRVKDKPRDFVGPISRFGRTLGSALKNNPNVFPRDWGTWNDKMKPKIPFASQAGLLQGILLETGGKPAMNQYKQPQAQHPVLLIIPKTARESIEMLCNQQVPGADQNSPDFNARFPNNNIVSSQLGSLISIEFIPQSGRNMAYYDVKPVSPYPIDPRLAASDFMAWENLLYIMTEEEQLQTIIGAYPAEAVSYVFDGSEYHDQLPEGIKGRWDRFQRSGAQVALSAPAQNPGYPPQGWQPQQPGYPQQGPQTPQAPGYPPQAPQAPQYPPQAPQAPQTGFMPSVPVNLGTQAPQYPPPLGPQVPQYPPQQGMAPAAPTYPPVAPQAPAAPTYPSQAPQYPPPQFSNPQQAAPQASMAPAVPTAPAYPPQQAPLPPHMAAPQAPVAPSAPPMPPQSPIGDPVTDQGKLADVRSRLAAAQGELKK